MGARAAPDEAQCCIGRRLLHDLLRGDPARQGVGQPRLAVGAQRAMQPAPAHVAVDQQRPVTRVGERQRKVGGHEGLAVSPSGRGHRHQHRSGPVGVEHTQADGAKRLDHRAGAVLVLASPAVLAGHMRHHPEDGQAHRFGHLLRIPQPAVHAVEHHRAQHRDPEAPEERHEDQERGIVDHRELGHGGAAQQPQVGQAADRGEPRLLVASLNVRKQELGGADFALEPRFLDGERRDLAQRARGGIHPLRDIALPRRQAGHQRAQHAGQRTLLQRLDLLPQMLHWQMLVRVVVQERA